MYNIVHSGDLKYGFTRLLDQADTKYPRVDALFIESTYGGSRDVTMNRQYAETQLMDMIKSTIENKGKVLIPVFSVGRSQEIMLVLESYLTNNPKYKLDVPVYLDGMILEASAIHTAYPEYLKSSLQHRILSNNSPFESEIFQVAKGEREEIVEKGPVDHTRERRNAQRRHVAGVLQGHGRGPEERADLRRLQQRQLPRQEDTERLQADSAARARAARWSP